MGKVYASLTSANLLRPSEDRMSYMAKMEKLMQNNPFIHIESIQEGYLAISSLSQMWEGLKRQWLFIQSDGVSFLGSVAISKLPLLK